MQKEKSLFQLWSENKSPFEIKQRISWELDNKYPLSPFYRTTTGDSFISMVLGSKNSSLFEALVYSLNEQKPQMHIMNAFITNCANFPWVWPILKQLDLNAYNNNAYWHFSNFSTLKANTLPYVEFLLSCLSVEKRKIEVLNCLRGAWEMKKYSFLWVCTQWKCIQELRLENMTFWEQKYRGTPLQILVSGFSRTNDINYLSNKNDHILLHACSSYALEEVKLLMEMGADFLIMNRHKQTIAVLVMEKLNSRKLGNDDKINKKSKIEKITEPFYQKSLLDRKIKNNIKTRNKSLLKKML